MSIFPLFFNKEYVENQVKQVRNEFTQKIQAAQQAIIGEIRQSSDNIITSYTEQNSKIRKDISTLHGCIDRLHPQLANVQTLIDEIRKLRAELTEPDIEKGNIDDKILAYLKVSYSLQKVKQQYNNIAETVSQDISDELEKIAKNEDEVHTAILTKISDSLLTPVRIPVGDTTKQDKKSADIDDIMEL
ncbi:MAG TPA: hypothetical protein VK667_04645 [Ktedonobacteraceae bacterium]|nr:hypothetical protein [Ktedonobacteraceae bacterium]